MQRSIVVLLCLVLVRSGSVAQDKMIEELIAMLNSPDQNARLKAAGELGKLGDQASEVVPALINALQDQDALVRAEAARSLGNIGDKAALAVPYLIATLNDKTNRQR